MKEARLNNRVKALLIGLAVFCAGNPGAAASSIYGARLGAFANKPELAAQCDGKLIIPSHINYDCAYGGYADTGNTERNQALLEAGNIGQYLYGGFAKQGNSSANQAAVSGGSVGFAIVGGKSYSKGNADSNVVTIKAGELGKNITCFEIAGGYSLQGGASKNTVTLLGGVFNKPTEIYGGKAAAGMDSIKNKINLGGYKDEAGVVLNAGTFIADKVTLLGGKGGRLQENELNIFSAGNCVQRLGTNSFQTINFYIPNVEQVKNTPMLTVQETVDLAGITAVRAGVARGNTLKKNDELILLQSNGAEGIKNFAEHTFGVLTENDFQDYRLDLALAENKRLVARIISDKENNENAKSPVETQAAALTMLNAGADMTAQAGFANAESVVAAEAGSGGKANAMAPYVAMGGSRAKVHSGSYCRVQGWNVNLGFAKAINNRRGRLLLGPLVEYGRGSYDSFLDNGLHGAGKSCFAGAGLMGKQTNKNGFYYEGVLRGGRLSGDYHANSNSYNNDSTYLGIHFGLGRVVKLSQRNSLNCYGKYFFCRQFGSSTIMHTSGDDVSLEFAKVDSHRLQIGSRFTHDIGRKQSVYVGLAWQYEFDGTACAVLSGLHTPAPSVKGHTGFVDVGCSFNPGKFATVDLGISAFRGKQEGFSVSLGLDIKL